MRALCIFAKSSAIFSLHALQYENVLPGMKKSTRSKNSSHSGNTNTILQRGLCRQAQVVLSKQLCRSWPPQKIVQYNKDFVREDEEISIQLPKTKKKRIRYTKFGTTGRVKLTTTARKTATSHKLDSFKSEKERYIFQKSTALHAMCMASMFNLDV